jgi:hypothetical protein
VLRGPPHRAVTFLITNRLHSNQNFFHFHFHFHFYFHYLILLSLTDKHIKFVIQRSKMASDCRGCIGQVERCVRNKSTPCRQCVAKDIDCIPMTAQEKLDCLEQRCQICFDEHRICRPDVLGTLYPCGNCVTRNKKNGGKCCKPQMYTLEKRKANHESPTQTNNKAT